MALLGVAAFAAFRLAELTRYSFWYDELFSIALAQMDWGDLIRAVVTDRTNPPLFYILLKGWMAVGGESVAWIRLLPCATGIVAAIPLAALARRTFEPLDNPASGAGRNGARPLLATGVTLAAAAASPLLVLLANEVRAYSLLLLLTATSLLAFARVAEGAGWLAPGTAGGDSPSWLGQARGEYRRRVAILGVVNTLLVYTHYFGWLIVAAEVGAALIWKRRALRGVALGALATGAAFVPWMAVVLTDVSHAPAPLSNVSWISRPALAAIPGFYDSVVARVLTIPLAWVGLVFVTVPLASLAFTSATWHADEEAGHLLARRRAAGLLWFSSFPVFAVFALSVATGRSAFVPRYLVVAAPAYWLLLGLAVTQMPGVARSAARLTLVAGSWSVFTLAAGTLRMMRGNEKIAWDSVAAAIAADAGGVHGTVYTFEGFTALPLSFYANTIGAPLTVRPGGAEVADGGRTWAVIRYEPGKDSTAAFAALDKLDPERAPLFTARIPSQVVMVFRLARR